MSKKRYFDIVLNGKNFILDSAVGVYKYVNGYASIWDAYNNPSRIKEAIWDEWKRWFEDHGGECAIQSRNCMQFTIKGYVYDENGNCYECYITKSYNRCWKVVEA